MKSMKFWWIVGGFIIALLLIFWPYNDGQKTPSVHASAKHGKTAAGKMKPVKAVSQIPKVSQPKMPLVPRVKGPLTGVLVILDPGHGGMTRWGIVDPGCWWKSNGQFYREAAYTYRMAKEVAEMVLAEGGAVAYTAWSPTMAVSTRASVAMPLPVKPMLPDGSALVNGLAGLKARVAASNSLYRANKAKYKLMTFISLHIDSQGPGQRGLHVCCDVHGTEPRLATLMAQAIKGQGYCWQKKGKLKPAIKPQGILVINGKYNVLRHRVLLECGIPGNPGDSWRLRNEASRRKMLKKVVVEPLIQLKKEVKWHRR